MAREPAQIPWPILGRRDGRRVDHELVCGLVQRRCRLKRCHIRPMAKLSLGVAANDVHILNLRHPMGLLLLTSQIFDRQTEHGDLQTDTGQKPLEILLPINVRRCNQRLLKDHVPMLLPEHIDAPPKILLHLMRRQLVKLHTVPDPLIRPKTIHNLAPLLQTFLAPVQEPPQLILIKGALGPLRHEIWRDDPPFDTARFR